MPVVGVGTGWDAVAALAVLDAVVAALAAALVAALDGAADAVVAAGVDVTALVAAVEGTGALDAVVTDVLPVGEVTAVVPPQAVSMPTPATAMPEQRASSCRRPIRGGE
jgi:hypothetical protein